MQSQPRPIVDHYMDLLNNFGVEKSIIDAIKSCRRTEALNERFDPNKNCYETGFRINAEGLNFKNNPIVDDIDVTYTLSDQTKRSTLNFRFFAGTSTHFLDFYSSNIYGENRLENIRYNAFNRSKGIEEEVKINLSEQRVSYFFKIGDTYISLIYSVNSESTQHVDVNNMYRVTLALMDMSAKSDSAIVIEDPSITDLTFGQYQITYTRAKFIIRDSPSGVNIVEEDTILDFKNLNDLMLTKSDLPKQRD